MTAPGHSSLKAAGGGTVSWHEFLHDLKTHWAVGQGFVPLPHRTTATSRGRETPSCCSSREEASGRGARKQLGYLCSEEVQVVPKDQETFAL